MTSLLLSAKRLPDGRIVLTNSKRDELPMQVVPTLIGNEMNNGADELRQALTMLNRGRSYQYVATRVHEAMLSAARVDVSEAVVERAD